MTNYEKIKNMSVEQMAEEFDRMSNYICIYCDCDVCPFNHKGDYDCTKLGFKDWLNGEVEE